MIQPSDVRDVLLTWQHDALLRLASPARWVLPGDQRGRPDDAFPEGFVQLTEYGVVSLTDEIAAQLETADWTEAILLLYPRILRLDINGQPEDDDAAQLTYLTELTDVLFTVIDRAHPAYKALRQEILAIQHAMAAPREAGDLSSHAHELRISLDKLSRKQSARDSVYNRLVFAAYRMARIQREHFQVGLFGNDGLQKPKLIHTLPVVKDVLGKRWKWFDGSIRRWIHRLARARTQPIKPWRPAPRGRTVWQRLAEKFQQSLRKRGHQWRSLGVRLRAIRYGKALQTAYHACGLDQPRIERYLQLGKLESSLERMIVEVRAVSPLIARAGEARRSERLGDAWLREASSAANQQVWAWLRQPPDFWRHRRRILTWPRLVATAWTLGFVFVAAVTLASLPSVRAERAKVSPMQIVLAETLQPGSGASLNLLDDGSRPSKDRSTEQDESFLRRMRMQHGVGMAQRQALREALRESMARQQPDAAAPVPRVEENEESSEGQTPEVNEAVSEAFTMETPVRKEFRDKSLPHGLDLEVKGPFSADDFAPLVGRFRERIAEWEVQARDFFFPENQAALNITNLDRDAHLAQIQQLDPAALVQDFVDHFGSYPYLLDRLTRSDVPVLFTSKSVTGGELGLFSQGRIAMSYVLTERDLFLHTLIHELLHGMVQRANGTPMIIEGITEYHTVNMMAANGVELIGSYPGVTRLSALLHQVNPVALDHYFFGLVDSPDGTPYAPYTEDAVTKHYLVQGVDQDIAKAITRLTRSLIDIDFDSGMASLKGVFPLDTMIAQHAGDVSPFFSVDLFAMGISLGDLSVPAALSLAEDHVAPSLLEFHESGSELAQPTRIRLQTAFTELEHLIARWQATEPDASSLRNRLDQLREQLRPVLPPPVEHSLLPEQMAIIPPTQAEDSDLVEATPPNPPPPASEFDTSTPPFEDPRLEARYQAALAKLWKRIQALEAADSAEAKSILTEITDFRATYGPRASEDLAQLLLQPIFYLHGFTFEVFKSSPARARHLGLLLDRMMSDSRDQRPILQQNQTMIDSARQLYPTDTLFRSLIVELEEETPFENYRTFLLEDLAGWEGHWIAEIGQAVLAVSRFRNVDDGNDTLAAAVLDLLELELPATPQRIRQIGAARRLALLLTNLDYRQDVEQRAEEALIAAIEAAEITVLHSLALTHDRLPFLISTRLGGMFQEFSSEPLLALVRRAADRTGGTELMKTILRTHADRLRTSSLHDLLQDWLDRNMDALEALLPQAQLTTEADSLMRALMAHHDGQALLDRYFEAASDLMGKAIDVSRLTSEQRQLLEDADAAELPVSGVYTLNLAIYLEQRLSVRVIGEALSAAEYRTLFGDPLSLAGQSWAKDSLAASDEAAHPLMDLLLSVVSAPLRADLLTYQQPQDWYPSQTRPLRVTTHAMRHARYPISTDLALLQESLASAAPGPLADTMRALATMAAWTPGRQYDRELTRLMEQDPVLFPTSEAESIPRSLQFMVYLVYRELVAAFGQRESLATLVRASLRWIDREGLPSLTQLFASFDGNGIPNASMLFRLSSYQDLLDGRVMPPQLDVFFQGAARQSALAIEATLVLGDRFLRMATPRLQQQEPSLYARWRTQILEDVKPWLAELASWAARPDLQGTLIGYRREIFPMLTADPEGVGRGLRNLILAADPSRGSDAAVTTLFRVGSANLFRNNTLVSQTGLEILEMFRTAWGEDGALYAKHYESLPRQPFDAREISEEPRRLLVNIHYYVYGKLPETEILEDLLAIYVDEVSDAVRNLRRLGRLNSLQIDGFQEDNPAYWAQMSISKVTNLVRLIGEAEIRDQMAEALFPSVQQFLSLMANDPPYVFAASIVKRRSGLSPTLKWRLIDFVRDPSIPSIDESLDRYVELFSAIEPEALVQRTEAVTEAARAGSSFDTTELVALSKVLRSYQQRSTHNDDEEDAPEQVLATSAEGDAIELIDATLSERSDALLEESVQSQRMVSARLDDTLYTLRDLVAAYHQRDDVDRLKTDIERVSAEIRKVFKQTDLARVQPSDVPYRYVIGEVARLVERLSEVDRLGLLAILQDAFLAAETMPVLEAIQYAHLLQILGRRPLTEQASDERLLWMKFYDQLGDLILWWSWRFEEVGGAAALNTAPEHIIHDGWRLSASLMVYSNSLFDMMGQNVTLSKDLAILNLLARMYAPSETESLLEQDSALFQLQTFEKPIIASNLLGVKHVDAQKVVENYLWVPVYRRFLREMHPLDKAFIIERTSAFLDMLFRYPVYVQVRDEWFQNWFGEVSPSVDRLVSGEADLRRERLANLQDQKAKVLRSRQLSFSETYGIDFRFADEERFRIW